MGYTKTVGVALLQPVSADGIWEVVVAAGVVLGIVAGVITIYQAFAPKREGQAAPGIFAKLFRPKPPLTPPELGKLYADQGKWAEAAKHYEKALEEQTAATGADSCEVAAVHALIALCKGQLGLVDEACSHYDEAIRVYRLLDDTDKLINALAGKGDVLGNYDYLEPAFECSDETVSLLRNSQLLKTRTAVTAHRLRGRLYGRAQKFKEALEAFNTALGISEEVSGVNHPDTALLCGSIGEVYCRQGDHISALNWIEKSKDILLAAYNHDDYILASAYSRLGRCYRLKCDYAKAMAWFKKGLDIEVKYHGPYHMGAAELYAEIGATYGLELDYVEAMTYLYKALPIHLKYLSPKSRNLARLYSNIGLANANVGNDDEAMGCYMNSYKIYRGNDGDTCDKCIELYKEIQTVYANSYHVRPFEDWFGEQLSEGGGEHVRD